MEELMRTCDDPRVVTIVTQAIIDRGAGKPRDLGKVFGLTPQECGRLASVMQWWDGSTTIPERVRDAGFDADSAWRGRFIAGPMLPGYG